MPLTWDATACKDKSVWEDENEMAITGTIVHLMIPIGFRTITNKNWREVYIRIATLEKVRGPMLISWEKSKEEEESSAVPMNITPEMVQKRINLRTNASEHSRATFHKNLLENVRRDIAWEMRKDIKV